MKMSLQLQCLGKIREKAYGTCVSTLTRSWTMVKKCEGVSFLVEGQVMDFMQAFSIRIRHTS